MDILPHEKQILEFEKNIEKLKSKKGMDVELSSQELTRLNKKLEQLKKKVYSSLTAWERVLICRHPDRPRSIDFINNISEEFLELHGDRAFRDDPAVIGGFAKIGGQKFMLIGQEKGCDTESRMHRNFGMLHPEGFRKAMRLAKMAEKFSVPIIFLLDTPGAYPGLAAEERGQGWAIAENLRDLARVATPIIILVVGEGCSGGALGMGVGDVVGMLEHSYYSVISPEGCASILWKDASKKSQAADALCMQAENLLEFGIVDEVIAEPAGGAHHDPKQMYQSASTFIIKQYEKLKLASKEDLLEQRYQKFRNIGRFSQDETTSQVSPSE